MRRTMIAAALVALLAAPAAAYPNFWVDRYMSHSAATSWNGKAYDCIVHPAPGDTIPHSPTPSTSTTFTITDPSNNPVTAVCPGVTYGVKIGLPSKNQHLLLTATITQALANTPTGCTGQTGSYEYGGPSPTTSYVTSISIPAGTSATSVELKVSSTQGGGTLSQFATTLAVGGGSCSGGPTPTPSPVPSPASSPNVSPAPSPSPVPSPAPKPNISNYTGTCPAAGACAVCESPTRCAACLPTKYVLNAATGQCDCAPGNTATTSTKSNVLRLARTNPGDAQIAAAAAAFKVSGFVNPNKYIVCTACSSGKVSPGGNKAKAVAKSCPSGTAANKEKSACVVSSAWSIASGYDNTNRRWATEETKLSAANAASLARKWNITVDADVSATPAVVGGRVYFPSWGGSIYCVDANTGALIWKRVVQDILKAAGVTVAPGDNGTTTILSRTGFAVSNGAVFFGLMRRDIGGYPYLVSLKASDGSLNWATKMHDNPAALITQTPTVYGGSVYIGVSSMEEARAALPVAVYKCCSFRGSFSRVNATTGAITWTTFTTPDGWSGASIWGSTPPVDPQRGLVFVATGDNYRVPPEVDACLKALEPFTPDKVPDIIKCEEMTVSTGKSGKDNWRNSVLALDIGTGAIKWGHRLGGPDAWNGACMQPNHPNCPDVAGPDYDFGQAPVLVTACDPANYQGCRQQLVVGQKAGIVWALSPDNGKIHWWRQTGNGGLIGGFMWGSAADDQRAYVVNNNYFNKPLDLVDLKAVPNTPTGGVPLTANGGHITALNLFDGSVAWTFTNPTFKSPDPATGNPRNALSQAAPTVANGVVLYSSMDKNGTLFYLEAATGKLLGSYQTTATLACAPSIINGTVYVGSGYANFGLGNVGTRFTALAPTTVTPPNGGGGGGGGGGCSPSCKYGCEDNGKCRSSGGGGGGETEGSEGRGGRDDRKANRRADAASADAAPAAADAAAAPADAAPVAVAAPAAADNDADRADPASLGLDVRDRSGNRR